MQFFYSAALVAASQPLLASAAILPIRRVASGGLMTGGYAMPNGTDGIYGSTGMVRSTGFGTGMITGTGAMRTTTRTSKTKTKTRTKTSSTPVSTPVSDSDDGSSSTTSTTSSMAMAPTDFGGSNGGGLGDGTGLDAPAYNLNNVTCGQLSNYNSSLEWNAVDGDQVVTTFLDMWNNNKLICSDCFGLSKDACQSASCANALGLKELSIPEGQTEPRWDMAAAHFSQDPSWNDVQCTIGTSACTGSPSCSDSNGPGSFVILKSLAVMNNALNNQFNAIQTAGSNCDDQMQHFSATFAPIPPIKDTAIFLGILLAIVGGLAGLVTGGVGTMVAINMLVGIGSSVGMDEFMFNQPAPADTGSILGIITQAAAKSYSDISDTLFANGTYSYASANGRQGAVLSLQDMMSGGQLLAANNGENDMDTLIPMYEKFMYQQLAVFTWENMEEDKKQHTPFIAFADGPCDKISSSTKGFDEEGALRSILNIDSSMTYNNTCYWLLDGSEVENDEIGARGGAVYDVCGIKGALPGGTNAELSQNSVNFQNLSLADFIIPSVDGWAKNGKRNDYEPASANGQLISDPRAPGVLNIPVCDYAGNPSMPGVRCPKLNTRSVNSGCDTWPLSAINNKPGEYTAGWCRVHVNQYQRNEGNENPLDYYQLEVTVFDDNSREIGDATKQSAQVPLAVQGSLPYQLIVAPGAGDDKPVSFWYADQYWDSTSTNNQCKVGVFDSGMRQMDCGFNCPYDEPETNPTASATAAHTLPAAPTQAAVGAQSYLNTFYPSTTATSAPASSTTAPPPKPTYATGWCGVHVVQHQKNEPDNQSPNYALEVTLYDAKQHAIGSSGQVQAPENQKIDVSGLVMPFEVWTMATDDQPIQFSYNGQNWNSSMHPQCSTPGKWDGYQNGARNMDCGFTC